MSINSEAYSKTASKLFRILSRPNVDRETIKDELYTLLVHHPRAQDHQDLLQSYTHLRDIHDHNIGELKRRTQHRTGTTWLYLIPKTNRTDHRFHRIDNHMVWFKRYYSIECSSEQDMIKAVERFAKAVYHLYSIIEHYQLNQNPDARVELKVQRNFPEFFTHTHTLVVHFNQEDLSSIIDRFTTGTMRSHTIPLRGTKRADRGFDLVGMNGKSHSQLVATIVADHMIRHRKEILAHGEHHLQEHLGKHLVTVSRMPIEEIVKLAHR